MNKEEQAIRDLVAQWHRATAAGDVEAILRLMAEDVMFFVPGKPPMKGRGTFGKALRELLTTHRIESTGEVQEVAVSGDLAYCWTTLTVRMASLSGGSSNARTGHALSVFRKQPGDSWVLIRDANLLPTPG